MRVEELVENVAQYNRLALMMDRETVSLHFIALPYGTSHEIINYDEFKAWLGVEYIDEMYEAILDADYEYNDETYVSIYLPELLMGDRMCHETVVFEIRDIW